MKSRKDTPSICLAGSAHFSQRTGGVELQMRHIGKVLHAHGWQVCYLCPNLHGMTGCNDYADGFKVSWFPNPKNSYDLSRRQIMGMLRDMHPDVIYMRGRSALFLSGIVQRFAARHRLPFIFAFSSDEDTHKHAVLRRMWQNDKTWWKKALLTPYALWADNRMGRLREKADALIVQHDGQLAALPDALRQRATVLHSLHPECTRPAVKTDPPMVLWVANYRAGKGGEYFLDLVESCRDLDVKFIMVLGQCRDAQAAALYQRSHGLANLQILRKVPLNTVEALFEQATLYVNTSRRDLEGFPNTFIQAWLRATPVISLHVDPAQVLQKKNIGICCRTPQNLIQNVRYLLSHPDDGWAMGQRAKRHAVHQHGLTTNGPRVAAFFKEMLALEQPD